MSQFLSLVFKPTLIYALLLSSCGAASISLSPLGTASVCPGGQILLTCETVSGSFEFLYWDVSILRLAMSREIIVSIQGAISTTALQFNDLHLTEFNVTRTSDSPLISQLLISNVTTEINGSTIYCSEDGDENGAPAVAVNIMYDYGRFLNVSLVNQFLENSNVTVTLQWPREPGAVYHIDTMPEPSHTEFITYDHNIIMHNNVVINLTLFYNIQYAVSIVSSLCGVTTTKTLKYVTCNLPAQLLNDPGSQDNPPLIEGQFITYTCPPGFVRTGPNASVCTGNGKWEPDPGQVACIADCEVPLPNAKLNYSSTLEGSILTLTCENDTSTDEQSLSVTCHSNGSWIPDPADFTCSPTAPPADCGVPLVDRNVTLNYNSTLAGSRSVLVLTCESDIPAVSIIKQIITVICHNSGNWIPDPAQFTCSSFTTVPPDSANLIVAVFSSTIIIVSVVCSIVFLSIGYAYGWFSQKHKQSRTRKAEDGKSNEGSQLPPTPGPLYEELLRSSPEHQNLVELKENVAYGPIMK